MNTFSTSPDMTLRMARYVPTAPGAQAEALATLRAIRAEKRQERTTWNPFAALGRRFTVPAPPARRAHVR